MSDGALHEIDGVLRVDMISDVICPWCYVGFRAFLQGCALRPDVPISLAMRPFELDPTIPKGGVDRKTRLMEKFGGDEARLAEMTKPLEAAGMAVGIAFDFAAQTVTPNTRDCHRLMRWARSAHAEAELMVTEALFQAYHVEGEDLSKAGTLVAIARGVGMDGDLVAELLASDADLAEVDGELEIARRIGVTAVPCFIFDQRFAVMGAQGPEAFARAIDQALAPPTE